MDKLDEKSKRLVAGAATLSLGRGGISAVARMGQVSRPTIYAGINDLKKSRSAQESKEKKRQRRAGGGHKNSDSAHPELLRSRLKIPGEPQAQAKSVWEGA